MGQEARNGRVPVPALIAAGLASIAFALAGPAPAQERYVSTRVAQAAAKGDPAKAAAPAYVDRVIEGLAPDVDESADRGRYDDKGWPRYLRLETRLGSRPENNSELSLGGGATAILETPNYGTLSLDAYLDGEDKRSAVTLRQRALPLDGGWLANTDIGVTTPSGTTLMRQPSRIFLPTQVVRGAATDWRRAAGGIELQASAGEAGRLEGYPVAGFRKQAGNVETLGAQAALGSWAVAGRHARTDGFSRLDNPTRPEDFIDSDSTLAVVRRQWTDLSIQANAVNARSSETGDTRRGLWVDGEWRAPGALYGFGGYRLDPGLTWSGQGMASDVEGLFARGSWRSRQWSSEGSVDLLRSVEGEADTGILVSGSGRWRYSRTLSLGAGGAVRRYNGNAGSGFADARWTHDNGNTGLRFDSSSGQGDDANRLTVDHGWNLPSGWVLNTSLTGGREKLDGQRGTLWGASASFSIPVSARALFGGTLTTEHRQGGERTSSANVSLAWQVTSNWSIEGNYVYVDGRQRELVPIDPLAPPPDRISLQTQTKTLYLVVRYEDRGGSRAMPLGGPSQGGGGRVEGVVFLDGNRSGAQEASEAGAPGVTVTLDGRYVSRTDAQGRFEFDFVATGTHVITVQNETLPLPWSVEDDGKTKVEVRVRDTVRVAIGAQRRSPE